MTKKEKFNIARKARRDRRIDIVYRATGDRTLANKLRDEKDSYIASVVENINFKEETKRVYYEGVSAPIKRKSKPIIEEEEPVVKVVRKKAVKSEFITIKETKKQKRLRLYNEATDAGYTHTEARAMRDLSQKKFDDILKFNKVKSIEERVNRWASMGKRDKYDEWIVNEAERINREAGLDENASFGWNAVYMFYTEGGTLEFWETYFIADPLNQNIYKARNKFTFVTETKGTRGKRLKF